MTRRACLLSSVMSIDWLLAQSIGASNGHRWIAYTIYCGGQSVHHWVPCVIYVMDAVYYCRRQLLSIDTSHNQLWLAMGIDGHASRSNVFVNDHCRPQETGNPVYRYL